MKTVWKDGEQKFMKKYMDPLIGEKLKNLNPGKDKEVLIREYYKRKLKLSLLVIGIGFLLGALLFISQKTDKKISPDGKIVREDYNGKPLKIPVTIYSGQFGSVESELLVDERVYSQKEAEEAFDLTEKWLGQVMTGKNKSLSCVREDLYLPDRWEEYGIDIAYSSNRYDLIDRNGKVKNMDLKGEESVLIKAELSYESYNRSCEYKVTVYPLLMTEEEKFKKELEQTLQDENMRQREKKTLQLPDHIGEDQISIREKADKSYLYMIMGGILAALLIYQGMDRDLDKLWERRKKELLLSYPDFVGKLALLTGAGMNAATAVKRIYYDGKKHTRCPLYEELGIFIRETDNGMLKEQALENLGKRSGLPQYRKFCSLLSVNIKKGSINLKRLLEQEAEEAFMEYQNQVKKLGEEAGTKLLLPMILMLAVVLVIIMVPAFMTYQIS